LCEERLAKYGVAKGKLPSTLEELFSLSNSSTLEDMDDGLGDGLEQNSLWYHFTRA
jgi:hypothetical protein